MEILFRSTAKKDTLISRVRPDIDSHKRTNPNHENGNPHENENGIRQGGKNVIKSPSHPYGILQGYCDIVMQVMQAANKDKV